jgi:hypothetical protein
MLLHKFDILNRNLIGLFQKFKPVVTKLCAVTKLGDLTVYIITGDLPLLSNISMNFGKNSKWPPMVYSGAQGKPIHEKNFFCKTPFNNNYTVNRYPVGTEHTLLIGLVLSSAYSCDRGMVPSKKPTHKHFFTQNASTDTRKGS